MGRVQTMLSALPDRRLGLAFALGSTLALGGCGGIDFQGKLFDYAGLTGSGNKENIRMAERPPLVVPPNRTALPPPGPGTAVATARPDWPTDTDKAGRTVQQLIQM